MVKLLNDINTLLKILKKDITGRIKRKNEKTKKKKELTSLRNMTKRKLRKRKMAIKKVN